MRVSAAHGRQFIAAPPQLSSSAGQDQKPLVDLLRLLGTIGASCRVHKVTVYNGGGADGYMSFLAPTAPYEQVQSFLFELWAVKDQRNEYGLLCEVPLNMSLDKQGVSFQNDICTI